MERLRKVEVVPYDPQWPVDYSREAAKIQEILGKELINMYHIGSTAIPGLSAKPVIDILVVVQDILKIDEQNSSLMKLDYTPKGEYGISGRRFFIKGIYMRTHHVHVFETGNPAIQRHVSFRDDCKSCRSKTV